MCLKERKLLLRVAELPYIKAVPAYTPAVLRRGQPLHIPVCASLTDPHFETGSVTRYCVTRPTPVCGTL